MAQDCTITLTMQGLRDDDDYVRLPVFVSQLQTLTRILGKIDRRVSVSRANHFRVVDLSQESPAAVVLEVCRDNKTIDTRGSLVSEFNRTAVGVSQGEPEILDRPLLQDFRNLALPVGEKISAASIKADGVVVDLTEEFAKIIELSLAGEEWASGSIEGVLEQINIHDGANVFSIYPEIGPSKVQCRFGSSLVDKAIAAVGERVAVSGMFKYKPEDNFPYTVDVDDIDIYPREDELPTFDDLRGIAPDATGDELSEDFIAVRRDGWQ